MILVDSSALIEWYRPEGDADVRAAVRSAIAGDRIAINGIIQAEILPFARSERERDAIASDFWAFHWLDLGRSTFDLASSVGFELRRQGITVPATDLVIAACAIEAGAELLHMDSHFEQIARASELRTHYPGGRSPPSIRR
jgi:hypothetical protein